VIAVGVAVAAGSVSSAATPAHQGAAEQAKKKKKRKKKCNSKEQSPLFNGLSCSRLHRTIPHDPSIPSGIERYDFCRNNTYRYRMTDYDFEGRYSITTYQGRWKVINSTSGSSGVSGAIQYTVTNFRSVYSDGTPYRTPPPSLLSAAVAFSPFGVDFGEATYLLGKAPC
jgi:hypothetical protein